VIRIEGEIVIERPVDEVFDFVADARNEPRYNPRMLRAEKLTPGPVGLGTRFRDEFKSVGRPAEVTIEVVGYERPRRLTDSIHLSTMEIRGRAGVRPRSRRNSDAVVVGVDASGCLQADDPGGRPHRPAPGAEDLGRPQARHGGTGSALLHCCPVTGQWRMRQSVGQRRWPGC
jgi:Polyketide cyclase / dehydrase and lipid transport